MKLTDIFNFGKHKGEQLEDVIYDDASYIEWLYDSGFDFADDALKLMRERGIV